MRSSRSIAAITAGTVLAAGAAAGAFAVFGRAQADDPPSAADEAMRTAPETDPDFTAGPSAPSATAHVAPTTAVVAGSLAGEWAREVGDWAAPRLKQVEDTARRYEPKFDLQVRQREGKTEARVMVAFDPAAQAQGGSRLDRLGLKPLPASEERKGRWFLFAADNKRAVGMNLLRDRKGEMKRSFTTERIAAIGDAQVGIGWRKGATQTSIGLVDREISVYGHNRDERFLAFTFSYKPTKVRSPVARPSGPRAAPPPDGPA